MRSPIRSARTPGRCRRRRSVASDQAGQAALDGHLVGAVALRFIMAVGGVEADHLALAAIGLERRLLMIDQGHDDLALARGVDLSNEREVAVENSFLDHRIARHLERVMLARAE